jgi:hypothetical protein
MSGWIRVDSGDLPCEDQPILFVNDLRENDQDRFMQELLYDDPTYVTVRFGYVNEVHHAEVNPTSTDIGDICNWIEVRVSPKWWSVTGLNGYPDHVTHWKPLPLAP